MIGYLWAIHKSQRKIFHIQNTIVGIEVKIMQAHDLCLDQFIHQRDHLPHKAFDLL